jgi:hypothetical protein
MYMRGKAKQDGLYRALQKCGNGRNQTATKGLVRSLSHLLWQCHIRMVKLIHSNRKV